MFKTSMNPKVSVLMPVYNAEKFLKEAIDSVLNQTFKDFELIIIDDCSKDNSWKIINSYKDKRIRAYRNEKNLGRPKTRNKLLSLISSQDYFLWFDSDDVILKDLLKDKVEYLDKNKDLSGLGSSIDYVEEDLNFIKRRVYPRYNQDIKKSFLLFSPLSQGGLMLKNRLKYEKYDEKYLVCQDYELWSRLINKDHKFENLKKSYYLYRQQKGQGKQKNLKLSIWNTLRIKSRYLFRIKYFSFKAFTRFLVECIALLLPKKVILWGFYKLK